MYLLDVNVLIALSDPNHVHHTRARAWFRSPGCDAWATCPITENGMIRILGQPGYPDFAGGPADARAVLATLTAAPGHQFWPDDVSLCDQRRFPSLPLSRHLTDLYLLALAVKHQGRLATFDVRIDSNLIPGVATAYYLIPDQPSPERDG